MKIVVFLEVKDGKLKRGSVEALTAAIATGLPVVGASVGSVSLAGEVALYGLTEYVRIEHELLQQYSSQATAAALKHLVLQEQASAVFLSANSTGKEVAPRLAVKLEAALIPDVTALSVEAGRIVASRPIFAGKAIDSVKARTERVVVTLRPNVFTARRSESSSTVKERSFSPALESTDRQVVVKDVIRNEGKLDVLEADVIVSGGRGLKGPENFHLIENLAKALGAAVGASRAVVDAGWRPHGEQVGQTGKTVSPKLYVACGISGAVQHLAGMSSSKVIAAINKDKDAPIFKVADYGIVGDVFDVLPRLTEKIAAITEKH